MKEKKQRYVVALSYQVCEEGEFKTLLVHTALRAKSESEALGKAIIEQDEKSWGWNLDHFNVINIDELYGESITTTAASQDEAD